MLVCELAALDAASGEISLLACAQLPLFSLLEGEAG